MAHVEVDQRLAIDAELHLEHDLVNRARRDIARHQVAVRRVHLFEEVPRLAVAIGPHASALAANRLRDEPKLVLALHRGRMHLDELAVGVGRSGLVARADRRSGVHQRLRRAAENETRAAGRDHRGVGGKRAHLERSRVDRDDAAAVARLVLHQAQHLPAFELADQARRFVTADLLVQCVQQLLAGGRARERGPMMLGAAEAAEIEQAFGRAIEHHAHPIEQVDDRRRRLAHRLDGRLMRQKVAAVNRVVKMNHRRVALAFRIDCAVDSALRAHRMRSLDGHDREQIDLLALLGKFHRRGQTSQPAAYYYVMPWHWLFLLRRVREMRSESRR